jgi:hypothetical protein
MVSAALPAGSLSSPRVDAGSPAPMSSWDGAHLHRRSSRWLVVPVLAAAAGAGALTTLGPLKALVGVVILLLAACVWRWPALAAYLVIGLTPLTVGISRGSAIPLVRLNEAIAILVGGTLAARGIVRIRTGHLPKLRLDRVELAMVLMAVANSLVPLLWMTVRQEAITQDDLLYALVLWKLLGLYVIVRVSVTTDRQVQRCLWLSVASASIVALLAILQSLGLLGIPHLLNAFYGPTAGTAGAIGLQNGRGASTLGLPAATADLCIFNLAIVSGLWSRYRRHRLALAAAAALLVMGTLAAGEFSSAIGLVVGFICMAIALRRPGLLSAFIPATLVAGYALRPVLAHRLSGFQSASGLPVSWTTRLQNLQTYFWPTLSAHGNFVLGVRPGARIAVPTQITGYVWIESGYTWLLWGGGIPLLAGFLFFVYAVARRGCEAARGRDGRSVAGIAVFAAIFVITTLMLFDPHLTYRGSADDFFFLLALAAPRGRSPDAADAEHRTPELVMTEVGS